MLLKVQSKTLVSTPRARSWAANDAAPRGGKSSSVADLVRKYGNTRATFDTHAPLLPTPGPVSRLLSPSYAGEREHRRRRRYNGRSHGRPGKGDRVKTDVLLVFPGRFKAPDPQ